MTALREKVSQAKSVAIIGGGFIGAEFADELSHGSKAGFHLQYESVLHQVPYKKRRTRHLVVRLLSYI